MSWLHDPRLALPLLLLSLLVVVPEARGEDRAQRDETAFLGRVRQLTFEGRRAGEGYFSPDGAKMVLQSEREPGNPFFQIYELDFETGETRRISPGTGKTTCPFYQPGTGTILYASTHHDPRSRALQQAELDFRASGRERRYEWDFDPEMELYVLEAGSTESQRLTHVRGYDAEGSYSPDGRWIVFSSDRQVYGRELSDAEAKQREIDPSFFNEIYIMRANGSETRRLTFTPGYDGGPFFMPDGDRILWRRFDEDGLIADIWTMKRDGSDATRITDFESMSWAPFAHPSGAYVFFTSNKHGFGNFELFIVDSGGQTEPVRVTFTDRFDGLPVPSPDGRRLAWTSMRNGLENGQIFIGNWNHENALKALKESPPRDATHEHQEQDREK